MTNTDTVLLIILTTLLSILILASLVVIGLVIKLILSVKRAVHKAETVIDSVESASEVFKDTSGRLALLKLIRNIVKLTKGKK